jgi:hypothetical protein
MKPWKIGIKRQLISKDKPLERLLITRLEAVVIKFTNLERVLPN